MTIENVKPTTPTIAIMPMNLTPSRSYLILIGFGNNIERTIDPLAVLNPVRTTIPFRDNQTRYVYKSRALWTKSKMGGRSLSFTFTGCSIKNNFCTSIQNMQFFTIDKKRFVVYHHTCLTRG